MNADNPITRLVLYDRPAEHVVRLTLNRPARRNAYNAQMVGELEQWLNWCERQSAVRAVILTAGGEAFCSGADLHEAFSHGGEGLRNSSGGYHPLQHLPRRKIWIAALNGHAMGGGLEMALACDFIVASEQVHIALPEVRHGLLPLGGAISQLAALLPPNIARELLLTGEAMDARRALALGLFNQVVNAERLADAALALAERLNQAAPLAVQACNALLNQALAADISQQSDRELQQLQRSEDYQESLRAFAERRAPQWQGR
ncbi:enoyl-CoA hydratase/isomerase family protein [Erwinia pyrifoliae]|uniref:enoyl-CoA hydratase/isomerase family protein n=1 Tax=Erwinia pyrifoliae TaxID=79967 RepID=UPI00220FFC89|nr:enoyl-CoA hydratase/isomerase family protein [Erwinia pyrifoliae]UWS28596.1 enoyl-CoA hydratase/isomerase family protein [Erwinia pyrifoliae]